MGIFPSTPGQGSSAGSKRYAVIVSKRVGGVLLNGALASVCKYSQYDDVRLDQASELRTRVSVLR